MAALVFGFVSCAAEDDDDEKEAITGSNNDYSISFTNEDDGMYRAYHSTFNKHLGGLCQITLDKDSTGEGSIGYIFDLESNPSRATKDARTLCIVGFNLATKGVAKPYVSHYTNVTDIQADNFGTKLSDNPAVETEYLKLGDSSITLSDCEVDGKYVLTVDVNGKDNEDYVVRIYKGKVEKASLATAKTAVDPITIPKEDLYPTTKRIEQKAAAVYVNVYAKKTMKATWHYADTYAEAEVVEE